MTRSSPILCIAWVWSQLPRMWRLMEAVHTAYHSIHIVPQLIMLYSGCCIFHWRIKQWCYKHTPTLQLSGNPVILRGFSGALANWPSWIICILHPARSWREVAVEDRKQWYACICAQRYWRVCYLTQQEWCLIVEIPVNNVACEKGSTHLMSCIWWRGVFACTK